LIAKQPYSDRFHAEIDATFGEYDLNRYTVDFGAPIIPEKLAFQTRSMCLRSPSSFGS
jgi:hypothetical protein